MCEHVLSFCRRATHLLVLAICKAHGSMWQAAALSVNKSLQPLRKTVAQASGVKVSVDVLDHLLEPGCVLDGRLLPARRRCALWQAPTDPGVGGLEAENHK